MGEIEMARIGAGAVTLHDARRKLRRRVEVTWHVDADGFRLPTEAEWEFACRAGSSAPHYGPLREVAWTQADGMNAPQPVGGKMPNLNGLFDTLGNARRPGVAARRE